MSVTASDPTLHDVASDWLAAFAGALEASDAATLGALFAEDCHWRDVLALTWHFTTLSGRGPLASGLLDAADKAGARNFELSAEREAPRMVTRAGQSALEAIYGFETNCGRGSGVIRLVPDSDHEDVWRGWTVSTNLDELKGYEEPRGARRPSGVNYARNFGGPNWLDQRETSVAYADREPAVVVVGGGQAGLGVAARLGQLGIDTLIIDRHERVGDNWRKRYHSLTLHNEVHVNHLPYMPFPETWPTYVPKDKLANWFESYVDAMELNFWTGTELVGGSYDELAGRWTLRVRRDGAERLLRPRHVIMATGVSGKPNRPDIPSLREFDGVTQHAGEFTNGSDWTGKRVLILGTGNSAHDIAQELHGHGAHATLVQRSPTTIVSVEPSGSLVYALYSEGPDTQDCDLLTASTPYALLYSGFKLLVDRMAGYDREVLDGLARIGFRMDDGEDRTGFQMKYLRRGGGYYMNVGCSELLIAGEVGLAHYDQIACFESAGARMRDGSLLEADLIVMATGYQGQQALIRELFGETIARRVGPVWGFDDMGELRNMWKRTGQPGLWFTAGSLAQCRIFSHYLALQIKAIEEGLIPIELPHALGAAATATR
ncbi:MAG: NAD(P)/FAD-dependent oxidoreductase [Pseudomonadota bacterium]